MANARDRDRRSDDFEDFGRRLDEHKSGGRLSVVMPKGVGFWTPGNADAFELDVIPFRVGPRINDYVPGIVHTSEGKLYYEQTYFVHPRMVGIDEQTVTCPLATFGRPCPICDHRAEMRQSKRYSWDDIKVFNPKERQLWLVHDRSQAQKAPLFLWDESYHNFGINLEEKVKKAHQSKREAYRRFAHPDEGFTLRLTARPKTIGKGKPFNEYFVDEFLDREPLPDALRADKHGIDLTTVPVLMPYEEMKTLFEQGVSKPKDGDSAQAGRNGDGDRSVPETSGTTSRRAAFVQVPAEAPPRYPDGGHPLSAPLQEVPSNVGRRQSEPEPEQADDGFRVGDVVSFKYRGGGFEGEVAELDADRGLIGVRVQGHDRLYWQPAHEVAMVSEGPDPGTPDPEPEPEPPPAPRGRGRAAAQPEPAPPARGRGRAAAAEPEAPPARGRGRAATQQRTDDEPFRDEDEPKAPPARGRGR